MAVSNAQKLRMWFERLSSQVRWKRQKALKRGLASPIPRPTVKECALAGCKIAK
jgi:hypothetical protein